MPDAAGSLQGLPPPFAQRLAALLPAEDFAACWPTFLRPRRTAFRLNPLRADPESILEELRAGGLDPVPLPFPPQAYVVPPQQRRALTESEACAAGRLYIQNAASMVPPHVLGPRPGEEVLDLAAAPGSKTLQLAALMENRGRVAAVEPVRSRFHRLRRNLEAGGATCVRAYLRDGTTVWRDCPERFDRVLVDAPCSAEGRFDASAPSTFALWSRRKIVEMARKQKRLLYAGIQCLRPGGVLVYSTCTFAPEENEAVVQRVLQQFRGALQVDRVDLPTGQARPGLHAWQGKEFDPQLGGAVRLLPDGVLEGFFVCRLTKLSSTLPPRRLTRGC
ncbi:MAG: RsmB/NOP family class I SAM-dependent RNA methyltransferase [Candidatus Latescibacterota bacterium]